MVVVSPLERVRVSVLGDGRWRVAVEPPEVTTVTVVSENGTVVVVVPPDEVKTWETVGDDGRETVAVPPLEVTTETEVGAGLV
jgi:hypothetical protein